MDQKSTEHTHQQIKCKPGVGNNNQGNSMDDSIDTEILPHCNQSNYNTHDMNIDGVSRLNIAIQGNQLRNLNLLDHENSLDTTYNCKNDESVDELTFCDRNTVSRVSRSNAAVMCDVVKLLDTTLELDKGVQINGVQENKIYDQEQQDCTRERHVDNQTQVTDIDKQVRNPKQVSNLQQQMFDRGQTMYGLGQQVCDQDLEQTVCPLNKSEVIAAKTRRLNSDSDSQTVTFEIPNGDSDVKQDNASKRYSGSGSDLESLGVVSGAEEGDVALIVGESQEPCECDECLFDTEPDAKPKPVPLLKKVLRVFSLLYLLCFGATSM